MSFDSFTRLDGRPICALRPQLVHFGALSSGPSCKIAVGNVKRGLGIGKRTCVMALLLCSPDAKSRNAIGSCHKPTFEVFLRPTIGVPKVRERGLEALLLKVLQSLVDDQNIGRITISLRLQILEDAGGLLAVCLNAMMACLLQSGLKTKTLPYAVSFGIVQHQQGGHELVILDPTLEESKAYCTTTLTILCEPTTGAISLTSIDAGSGGYEKAAWGVMKNLATRAANACMTQMKTLQIDSFNTCTITFDSLRR